MPTRRWGPCSRPMPTASVSRAVKDVPVLADVIEWQRIVQLAENAHYYGPLPPTGPEGVSAGQTQRLEAGLAIDSAGTLGAITGREPAYRAVAGGLKGFSAVLTPAALGPAPEGRAAPRAAGSMNGLWTYLGVPTVGCRCLEVRGLHQRAARRPAPRRRTAIAHGGGARGEAAT